MKKPAVQKITDQRSQPDTATLRCFAVAVDGVTELPNEILAVPWGVNETPNGRLICNEVTARVLPKMQAAMNWTEPHSDLEHNSVERKGFVPPEPQVTPSRGRWEVRTPAMSEAPGLYFVTKKWTEEGKRIIGGGSYPCVSVACQTDERDQIVFGHSLAFCRQGAVTDARIFNVALGQLNQNQNDNKKMDLAKLIEAARKAGHDVPDDATVETLAALLFPEKPAAEDGAVKMFTAALGEVKKLVNGLNERMDKAELSAEERERAAVVSQLAGEGVVIPLSPDMLKRFSPAEILKESANWERGAPIAGGVQMLAAGGVRTFSVNTSGGSTADKTSVAEQLGLSAEDMK